jgi:hypothetical protein
MQSCGCIDILRTRSGMSPGMALGFFWALGGLFFQGWFLSFQRHLTIYRRTKRIISIFSWPCQGGSTYRRAIRNFRRKMVCKYLLANTLYECNRRWCTVALKCFSARWFPVSIMYISGQICLFLIKLSSMAIAPVIGNVTRLFVHKSHPNCISRMYTNLANIYSIVTRLYVCDHRTYTHYAKFEIIQVWRLLEVRELVVSAEEVCALNLQVPTNAISHSL